MKVSTRISRSFRAKPKKLTPSRPSRILRCLILCDQNFVSEIERNAPEGSQGLLGCVPLGADRSLQIIIERESKFSVILLADEIRRSFHVLLGEHSEIYCAPVNASPGVKCSSPPQASSLVSGALVRETSTLVTPEVSRGDFTPFISIDRPAFFLIALKLSNTFPA